MTPAHKRAMTKTLLGLIAAFGVWLAPPEPPRPLLARQRDEHSSLAYPAQHCREALGIGPNHLARLETNDMWHA